MVSATDGANYPMRGAGVVGPDGNQGAGKPSDTTVARITAQPPYLPPDTLLSADCTIAPSIIKNIRSLTYLHSFGLLQ